MRLSQLIRDRKDRKSPFGYGLGTADTYVKQVLSEGAKGFHIEDEEAALKYASDVLTYASEDMAIEEKATASGKFKGLLEDGMEVPKNTLMVIRHTLTTTKEDRDNDVLETKGASLDPKAPLLWQHMHTLPIGGVLGKAAHTDEMLKVISALVDLNDLTADAAKLVEADVLRFSHGFRALEFEERKDQGEAMFPGFRVTKFEIMEASLVSVPSNTDAAVEAFSKAKLESEYFKSMQKDVISKSVTGMWRGVDIPAEKSASDDLETQLLLRLGGAEFKLTPTQQKQLLEESGGDAPVPESIEKEIVPVDAEAIAENIDEQVVEAAQSQDEEAPQEVPAEASVETVEEKGGRSISAANLKVLQDVKEDIDELGGMEIPRAAKALCSKCSSQLGKVINNAKPQDDEDEPEEEKKEFTVKDAASLLLSKGTSADLQLVKDTIDALLEVQAADRMAKEYRALLN